VKDPQEIRAALTGPLASVPTLFQRDGSIDFDGLRRFIDFVLDAGAGALLLTFGDSLFSLLSDAEIARVTRTVVDHTAGRALVVAADGACPRKGAWATSQTAAFAGHVAEMGADMLMVLPPNWGQSCTLETMVAHYAAAAAHLPVMVVTNLFARRPALGLEVLRALCDRVQNVVAVKDDVGGEFARKLGLMLHPQWAVIAGGQKQNHLNMATFGCDGYLSTFIKFKPEIARAYWQAFLSGDTHRVQEIVAVYDMPFFDLVQGLPPKGGLPGGFDAGIHGAMEIFGIAGRWRRAPYHSLTDEEMERLAAFLRKKPCCKETIP